jgi:two-component system, chemotaxis family, chemotaxis protein CheY
MIGDETEFKSTRVLIVSAKAHVVQTMRHLLAIAGVQHIAVAQSAKAGLERLCAGRYGAVFCCDSCGEIDGAPFASTARRNPSVSYPMVPIFLLCNGPRQRDVERARDTGYSDVLARPINAATVIRKLHQSVNNPRPFIVAPDFFGPDRRASRDRAFSGKDRRKRMPRKVKLAVRDENIVEI